MQIIQKVITDTAKAAIGKSSRQTKSAGAVLGRLCETEGHKAPSMKIVGFPNAGESLIQWYRDFEKINGTVPSIKEQKAVLDWVKEMFKL